MSINQDLEKDVIGKDESPIAPGWSFKQFRDGPHYAVNDANSLIKCFFDDEGDFICDAAWVPGSVVHELIRRGTGGRVEPEPNIVDVIGPTVTIDRRTYDLLCLASAKLDALVAEGVDNWEGYGHAMQAMHDAEEYGTEPSR